MTVTMKSLFADFAGAMASARHRRQIRRSYQQLHQLSDHLLNDIGFVRDEIDGRVRDTENFR